jgi:DNA-directed RNA polymerase specialized sigma24 family protein
MVHEKSTMDFLEIYQRHARDVHRFSLYLSGNYALAEDLTAETFVHAMCGPTHVRVDSVKAYWLLSDGRPTVAPANRQVSGK